MFAVACAFLYVRLARDQGMHGPLAALVGGTPWTMLGAVAGLMAANWTIEAVKWRRLLRPVERLRFRRALAGTLAGTTIGLITPNRVGEFAGRILFLEPEHRVAGGFATVLGSIAQFVVTLLAGGAAVMAGGDDLFGTGAPPPVRAVIMWSAVSIGCAAVLLYFNPAVLARLLLAVPWLDRFERHVRVLEAMDRRTLTQVFALSALRYAVFTAQYALVASALAGTTFAQGLATVPVVFLLTTLVPTTAITELGVRGSVAAAFIPGDAAGVVAASALIWAVNLLLPAAAGGVILLVARIRTGRSTQA